MDLAARHRPNTAAPGDGSRTMTITNDPTKEEGEDDQGSSNPTGDVVGTLRLRAAPRENKPRVAWNEDVIDNEGCGKKKSKICCIYHKPRRFDESSDESDSDSDSDSSSVCGGNHNYNHSGHNHQLQAGSSSHGQQLRSDSGSGVVHELERPIESEPNAYEKQPKGKRKA